MDKIREKLKGKKDLYDLSDEELEKLEKEIELEHIKYYILGKGANP